MRLRFQAEEQIDRALNDIDLDALIRSPDEYGKRLAVKIAQAALESVGAKAVAAGGKCGEAIRGS
jgi:hypothetical protein